MVARRPSSLLSRLRFADPVRAAALLAGDALRWWDADANAPADARATELITAVGRCADPDAALVALDRLAGGDGAEIVRQLDPADAFTARLLALVGTSTTLAEQLCADVRAASALAGEYDPGGAAGRLAAAVGADANHPVTGDGGTPASLRGGEAIDALRTAYRRELIAIAGRDLTGEWGLQAVTEALAGLAGDTLAAALAVAAAEAPADAAPCRLAVIGMGKAGGRELNYVSDVDVIFVAEPSGAAGEQAALASATELAQAAIRVCRAVAWQVDAALRPEGKDGPLVRTLASHAAYYRRWASTWEFQALLKARPLAGDAELGRRYVDTVAPMVWSAAERPDFVADVRAMRRRVLATLPADVAPREIKLGRGGLRDIEFAVQLLQLVHGRGDVTLRETATLPALAALRDGGYVGRDDAHTLIEAYGFLRTAEHRLQLRRLRRTHLVPADDESRAWLARAMGFRAGERGTARVQFEAEWARTAREVRRLHEKLFYRPLLEAVARVPTEGLRLTAAEAGRRLAALGFTDPKAALRHIFELTAGLSRRAALQRTLLPVLLADFADAPDPDTGLLAYRQVSDALGSTPWFLRLLRDEGRMTSRLAHLLGTSRYVTRMLMRAPDALAMLADDAALRPRRPSEIVAAMRESAARQDGAEAAVAAARGVRRQELLRTAFADLLGQCDVGDVCAAISAITEATLQACLRIAAGEQAARLPDQTAPFDFAVVAMGRLGGAEVGYGSDADVLFVYEPHPGADDALAARLATELATRLRALLAAPSASDPPLHLDATLRPEGKAGPLARSLAAYTAYYARWSAGWEAQALLRARAVAGDEALGRRFIEMVDRIRYPHGGLDMATVVEIRRLKGRVDAERLPRGADPATHTKLGRGGLADIEWTVQLLQLAHGARVAGLRTTRTLAAIDAARAAGYFSDEAAEALREAWQNATRVRNAIMLVTDKPGDQLPHPGRALLAVGRALGYPPDFEPGQLIDDYRRSARRARKVVEETFYAPLA